uniref:DUF243 domain-containing protein n=1 Tax=Glossina palpalis gambiensis TaxID=67801 RepID=A0A1B0BPA4_9MUSC
MLATDTIKNDVTSIQNGIGKLLSVPKAFNENVSDLKPATLTPSPSMSTSNPLTRRQIMRAIAQGQQIENNYPSRTLPRKILPASISCNCDSENKESNKFTSTFEENVNVKEAMSMSFQDDKNTSNASASYILHDQVPTLRKKLPISIQFQILENPSPPAPVEAEERLTMRNACLVNCRLGCLPYLGKTGKSLIVSLVISLATGFTIYANGCKKSIQCGQQLPADQSVYYANSKRPNNHNEIIDVQVPTRADANKILLQLPKHHQVYSSASPSQPFYVAPRKQYRITLIRNHKPASSSSAAPEIERNTLIYVIIKKPDQSNVNPPEVYFINYKASDTKTLPKFRYDQQSSDSNVNSDNF